MQELSRRLRDDRPGLAARSALSPLPHRGRLSAAIPAEARPAAVLMLVVPERHLWMPLMRRQRVDGDLHSGQISLPGGVCEPGEDPVSAALRETEEELGIVPSTVTVLGELDPQWIPVSGFVVHPVVATAHARSEMICDPREVDLGFWIDASLLRRAPVIERPGRRGERRFTMRGWELEQGFLWGATAMMLAELLEMLPGD